ncbi:MAG: FtsQ-type POTRA domain-containing protein [Clostridia bacterium]|nr:FtsQ-type POTRA domain-containing protein [Clostridia bacterium]
MVAKRRLRRVKRKPRRPVFRILFLIILGSLSLFYFIQSPFWEVETVMTEGNEFVSEEELIRLADIPPALNIFKVDLNRSKENILLHPLVKNVELTRKLPRQILITIEERTPVALLPSTEGFCQVDEQGYILRHVPAVSDVDLPLITGLALEKSHPGYQITSPQLEEAIKLVTLFTPALKEQVAEIDLSHDDTIYLHTVEGIQVNFGNAERVEEKAALMGEILAAATVNKSKLEYIDVSFGGSPVVKYAQ